MASGISRRLFYNWQPLILWLSKSPGVSRAFSENSENKMPHLHDPEYPDYYQFNQRAIDPMKMSGICAQSDRCETEDYIRYTVTIPKSSLAQPESHTPASSE